MDRIEIITIRFSGKIDQSLLNDFLKEAASRKEKGLITIKLYRHAKVETDFSIHLHWKPDSLWEDKSDLGQKLAFSVRDFGKVHHAVWNTY